MHYRHFPTTVAGLRQVGALAAVMLAIVQPAFATDSAAAFLTHLYADVCVANLGRSDKVRAWASEHSLPQIQNPAALQLFVGAGDKGGAWRIESGPGRFVLSIRGLSSACAVWAQAADPVEVEDNFKTIVENVRRPGIEIAIDKNTIMPSPWGSAHALVYNVTAPSAPTSLEFTMLTAERSGGPFQASMQAALAGPHSSKTGSR